MKSNPELESFIEYCKANPQQRFWQALRNWSKWNFIYGSESTWFEDAEKPENQHDTFYD